ncbi:M15 family metallopeptidase [Shewanella sp. SNU WT4]|nr:M15 family metallopeptidase [Shewanella sp. SNU WT4]
MNNDLSPALTEPSWLTPCFGVQLSKACAQAFSTMKTSAASDGIDLMPCSGYRSFERQLTIWNNKARGLRPLLDANEQPLNYCDLTDDELVDTILLWSALPGASRHHWGCDVDVYDAATLDVKQLQLVQSEYNAGGPCAKLSEWLAQHAHEFGFFLPFQQGLSGVSPEPWHISYAPESTLLLRQFSSHALYQVLSQHDICLKAAILPKLEHIVAHYVRKIAPIPASLRLNNGPNG